VICNKVVKAGLAIVFSAVVATAVHGENFAPAVPADGGELRPWEADALRTMEIPAADAVGIPAYPGARVAQVLPGGEMTVNEETHRYNPSIKLLSPDSEEQVAEFYREALEGAGWSGDTVLGMTWFWQGDEPYHPLDIAAIGLVPAVGIMPPGPLGRMMPGAQSLIEIRYSPQQ
jgi:hypothetical protein